MPLAHISRPTLFAVFMGTAVLFFMLWSSVLAQAGSKAITGYAWSSNIGWISFSGIGYGVFENPGNGALSGYAWSSNIGWITFNASDVSGCPSGSCAPKINLSTGNLSGWARACAAFSNKTSCSGALEANGGGWDGWIALAGTAQDGSSYGVTQNGDCAWTGYAWGSDAIGAINMSGVASDGSSYGVTGTDPGVCSGISASLSADPAIIDSGESSTLTWDSANATSCVSLGGFSTGGRRRGSDSTGTLSSTQNYQVTCSSSRGSANSNIATVTVLIPTVSISAAPSRIATGSATIVSWNATNVNSCRITKNGALWQTLTADASRTVFGSAPPDTITSQATYVITCTNSAGTNVSATQVVNILPTFNEF